MKLSILACQMSDMSLKVMHDVSIVPLLEKAKSIRASGELNGEQVLRGMVAKLNAPQLKFRCEPSSVVDAPKRKGKKTI